MGAFAASCLHWKRGWEAANGKGSQQATPVNIVAKPYDLISLLFVTVPENIEA